EVGQVQSRAVAAGQDQRVKLGGLHVLDVLDVAARDAGRLHQHVALFVGFLAGQVVDHHGLLDVGRHADGLDAHAVKGQQSADAFMDLGAVFEAATGKDHSDFVGHVRLQV